MSGVSATKLGRIFSVDGKHPWNRTHTQVPCVDALPNDRLRIYYSTRDDRNRSRISFIEVRADDPREVVYVHDRPILEFGDLGCFDDTGVMPSCLVTDGGKKYLYYSGWNTSTTVRHRNSIGLAVSEDGGVSFRRAFAGPILDRTKDEPHLVVTPHVLVEDGVWRMWYCGCTEWKVIDGVTEPQYLIKYAESRNGFDWQRENKVVIGYKNDLEAIGRPFVVHENGLFRMWYCYRSIAGYRGDRGRSYRIGYAESPDNDRWVRKDQEAGLEVSDEGWDSEMLAYPYVVDSGGKRYMFYNGNGFGRSGLGVALLDGP